MVLFSGQTGKPLAVAGVRRIADPIGEVVLKESASERSKQHLSLA
jgi:hypothetical protein